VWSGHCETPIAEGVVRTLNNTSHCVSCAESAHADVSDELTVCQIHWSINNNKKKNDKFSKRCAVTNSCKDTVLGSQVGR